MIVSASKKMMSIVRLCVQRSVFVQGHAYAGKTRSYKKISRKFEHSKQAGRQGSRKLLWSNKEPDPFEADDFSPENEELDMFVLEKMADSIESEYLRVKSHLDWNEARRSMERGPQHPNLLTVSQRRELRRLAAEDPDHWRPQRLAAAFGIPADAVWRLLKSRWEPTTPEEQQKHDRKVAGRRKALGLPTPSLDTSPTPPSQAEPAARPRGPMTALLNVVSTAPMSRVQEGHPVPKNAVSTIYKRDEVLQFPVSNRRADDDGEVRNLDVTVNLPQKYLTLDELKRLEKNMERRDKLKSNPRAPRL